MTAARVAGASAMAVVTVHGDRAEDYVVGGMAVERVWITATAAELGVTPIEPGVPVRPVRAGYVIPSPRRTPAGSPNCDGR